MWVCVYWLWVGGTRFLFKCTQHTNSVRHQLAAIPKCHHTHTGAQIAWDFHRALRMFFIWRFQLNLLHSHNLLQLWMPFSFTRVHTIIYCVRNLCHTSRPIRTVSVFFFFLVLIFAFILLFRSFSSRIWICRVLCHFTVPHRIIFTGNITSRASYESHNIEFNRIFLFCSRRCSNQIEINQN